jgi:bisanhydrobacterioruberin hydratase
MKQWITTYRPHIAIGLLVILYGVGLVGMQTGSRAWFLAATPLTLVISAALLVWNQGAWNVWAAVAVLACVVGGFLVEVLGVHTGVIFGEYWYGPTLGAALWGVPAVIGLNWLLLVWATGTLAHRLRILPGWGRAALAATCMTGLDVLIEPVAMRLDFWQWAGDSVPLRNYLGWWVVAFILLTLFEYLPFRKENPVAGAVLALQFTFFGVLNVLH